ncbi:MAG: hypothetical protein ABEJ79_04390 [Halolamina sp.]
MSSQDDTRDRVDGGPLLDASPGTQTLLALDAAGAGFDTLPDAALEHCLILSPCRPSGVAEQFDRRDVPVRGCGHLYFGTEPPGYDGPLWTDGPINPADATEISIRFSKAFSRLDAGSA